MDFAFGIIMGVLIFLVIPAELGVAAYKVYAGFLKAKGKVGP